ncbi:MAG: hypothetical protein IT330_11385 [Anaerolineae bacterium]|nr:hypothetical protein [Anaerolineae bacterium]
MTAVRQAERRRRWFRWTTVFERLPVPYAWTIILVSAVVMVVEQVLEHWIGGFTSAHFTTTMLLRRLTLPLLTVYMLTMLRLLKRTAIKALGELRPAVQIGDQEYDNRVRRMVGTDRRMEALLLLASAVVVVIVFVVFHSSFPIYGWVYLPANPFIALFMLGAYTLFGWVGLTLVYSTLRFGQALGNLARCPLEVNVFDPTNLLPFGRLALIHSLPPAGVVLILIIALGRPTGALDYMVILLATLASLMALVIPLLGVHEQMDEAKDKALVKIHEEFKGLYKAFFDSPHLETKEIGDITNRTGTLVNLRRLIQEAPSWPFRDAATTVRAVVAATSPLIYFLLIEITRLYVLPLLNRTGTP